MKLFNYGLAALLTCLPLTVEAMPSPEVRALNNAERDRYFREANLAIMKYYQCLDEANALADEFKNELESAVWDAAMEACVVIAWSPGTAYEKGITVLGLVMANFAKSDYFGGLSGEQLAKAKRIDELIAQAEGWYHTYIKARNALLRNEHPQAKGMADDYQSALICLKRFDGEVEFIEDVLGTMNQVLDDEGRSYAELMELIEAMRMVQMDPYKARDALYSIWVDYERFTGTKWFDRWNGGFNQEDYQEWQEDMENSFIAADHYLRAYFKMIGFKYD